MSSPIKWPALILAVTIFVSLICVSLISSPTPATADVSAKPKASSIVSTSRQTRGKAMWGPPSLNGVSQFPVYKDLGVGIYELAIAWSDVAPTKPTNPKNPNDPAYVWQTDMEAIIKEANSYGMQVSMMVIGAPAWANGGYTDRAWTPTKTSDYADFMQAMSKKYPRIKYWMVWGEPNRSPNYKPLTPSRGGPLDANGSLAPRNYGKLLDKAYGAIKQIDKMDKVIGGNTYTAAGPDSISTYQWLRYMRLPSGRMPRMDFWGHNPFSFRKPNLSASASPKGRVDFSDLGRLIKKIDRYYPKKKMKLFLSEWGVPAGDAPDAELGFALTEIEQAQWIRAGFTYKRRWPRIATLGWIHPFDRPDIGITTGLMDAAGNPKLGYEAFKRSPA